MAKWCKTALLGSRRALPVKGAVLLALTALFTASATFSVFTGSQWGPWGTSTGRACRPRRPPPDVLQPAVAPPHPLNTSATWRFHSMFSIDRRSLVVQPVFFACSCDFCWETLDGLLDAPLTQHDKSRPSVIKMVIKIPSAPALLLTTYNPSTAYFLLPTSYDLAPITCHPLPTSYKPLISHYPYLRLIT